jgi:hypothetical protein
MGETDPEQLADHLEAEADDLKRRSEKLEQRTKEVSQEWQRKRSDPSIPGASPPEGENQD